MDSESLERSVDKKSRYKIYRHVFRSHKSKKTYCGHIAIKNEWVFLSPEHAELIEKQQELLMMCPECKKAINSFRINGKKKIMTNEKPIEWYKYESFWRRGDADGDNSPQDRADGTGDLIFNTLSKILYDQDSSPWAIESFMACGNLLMTRKRYPDEFLVGLETKNMIQYWFRKNFLKIPTLKPQRRMSRDPFIALGSVYAFFMLKLENEQLKTALQIYFKLITIPFHLRYSINTMRWWRKLKEDNRKHYVIRLDYIKALGTRYTFEYKYEDNFYKNTV